MPGTLVQRMELMPARGEGRRCCAKIGTGHALMVLSVFPGAVMVTPERCRGEIGIAIRPGAPLEPTLTHRERNPVDPALAGSRAGEGAGNYYNGLVRASSAAGAVKGHQPEMFVVPGEKLIRLDTESVTFVAAKAFVAL